MKELRRDLDMLRELLIGTQKCLIKLQKEVFGYAETRKSVEYESKEDNWNLADNLTVRFDNYKFPTTENVKKFIEKVKADISHNNESDVIYMKSMNKILDKRAGDL